MEDEHRPLLEKGVYRTYRTRWYVLIVCAAVATVHFFSIVLLTAIARSLQSIFGWHRGTFAMFQNYCPIEIILFVVPAGWVQARLGLRRTTIMLYFACFLAAFVRCFPTTNLATTVLTHLSQILSSFPGVFSLSLPTAVSLAWFPPDERMMATSIGCLMNEFGAVFSYMIGPNVVDAPGPGVSVSTMAHQYYQYTWVVAAVIAALTIGAIIYLPASPKTPPSASAVAVRLNYADGTKRILKSKEFWILNLTFSVNMANYITFVGILNLFLEYVDVTQVQSGFAGVAQCILVVISGFVFGTIAGKCRSPIPAVHVVHSIGLLGSVWLLLNYYNVIPRDPWSSGVAVVLYGAGSAPTLGLLQEITNEVLYPVNEVQLSAFTMLSANVVNVITFGIASVPTIPLTWLFWYLPISRLIVMILFACPRYVMNRSSADDANLAEREAPLTTNEDTEMFRNSVLQKDK